MLGQVKSLSDTRKLTKRHMIGIYIIVTRGLNQQAMVEQNQMIPLSGKAEAIAPLTVATFFDAYNAFCKEYNLADAMKDGDLKFKQTYGRRLLNELIERGLVYSVDALERIKGVQDGRAKAFVPTHAGESYVTRHLMRVPPAMWPTSVFVRDVL